MKPCCVCASVARGVGLLVRVWWKAPNSADVRGRNRSRRGRRPNLKQIVRCELVRLARLSSIFAVQSSGQLLTHTAHSSSCFVHLTRERAGRGGGPCSGGCGAIDQSRELFEEDVNSKHPVLPWLVSHAAGQVTRGGSEQMG